MEEYNFIGARLMPVLPIRGISVFPGTMLTFDVERPASKAALDAALAGDQIIFLTAQKDPMVAQPSDADVYHMGTICRIKQVLKNSNCSLCLADDAVVRSKGRWWQCRTVGKDCRGDAHRVYKS